MAHRIRAQFNLLPRPPRRSKSLVAVVRQEVAEKGKKWLACSKRTKLPDSLAEIGGIELKDWDIYSDGLFDARSFIRDFSEKIIQLYGPFGEGFELKLKGNLNFAVGELIKNAVLHGNAGRSSKKVLVCFRQVKDGFVIDVFDEGRGPLFLVRRSWQFREFAAWFRLGYGGKNCGLLGIQRDFGSQNITAAKIYNESGRRVGTRVSLLVRRRRY